MGYRFSKYLEELISIYKSLTGSLKLKSNPFNYPIINKWNNRILRRNRHWIFCLIEEIVNQDIAQRLKDEDLLKKYLSINKLPMRLTRTEYFQDLPKVRLGDRNEIGSNQGDQFGAI